MMEIWTGNPWLWLTLGAAVVFVVIATHGRWQNIANWWTTKSRYDKATEQRRDEELAAETRKRERGEKFFAETLDKFKARLDNVERVIVSQQLWIGALRAVGGDGPSRARRLQAEHRKRVSRFDKSRADAAAEGKVTGEAAPKATAVD